MTRWSLMMKRGSTRALAARGIIAERKCEQQVVAIANGLAAMWEDGRVTRVTFEREDEDREYDIAIDSEGLDV